MAEADLRGDLCRQLRKLEMLLRHDRQPVPGQMLAAAECEGLRITISRRLPSSWRRAESIRAAIDMALSASNSMRRRRARKVLAAIERVNRELQIYEAVVRLMPPEVKRNPATQNPPWP